MGKKRITYYDALKTFSIFVVIMAHIFLYSFHETDNMVCIFTGAVNMPMFMFVSGLLSGKPSLQGCKKKLRILLLPTIIVGVIYTYIKGLPVPSFFTNSMHFGYWFCFTLWMYHVLYFLTFKLSEFLKLTTALRRSLLLSIEVVILLLISRLIPYDNIVTDTLSLQCFFKFLPYFAYGVVLSLLPNTRVALETNNQLFSFSLLSLFVLTYIGLGITLVNIVIAFAYINVMVYIFYQIFNKRNNRIIEYIGKRTLDIYLFHYFLLPSFIVEIPSIFNPDTNILYTLIPMFLLSFIVLFSTLLLTKLIEYSKILSYLMLGKQ